MTERSSSFHKLTEGINLEEIAWDVRGAGLIKEAGDLQVLRLRIERLQKVVPITADKMDVEKYMAWDIIKEIRRILKCPDEEAIVIHCENLMKGVDEGNE